MAEKFDRCRCSGLLFKDIKREANKMNTTSIKRLKHELDMGIYCSACAPYLKEMFKTGRTSFSAKEEVAP